LGGYIGKLFVISIHHPGEVTTRRFCSPATLAICFESKAVAEKAINAFGGFATVLGISDVCFGRGNYTFFDELLARGNP
jgi:hypothetical protein